ncbi:MAG: GNAT family N-acetyltransferase [Provencibacterium sp.]|nr:GNAT family N-acetyltransferase [Provencibacterium sp.]
MPGLTIRQGTEADIPPILCFIKELAEYEHMSDQVTADETLLRDSLFLRKMAEVIIGELDGQPVAFALYFYNFSTFLGKPGLYLEDLFVKPAYRNRGIGKRMIAYLARRAVEQGCGRMEWSCLDWNAPSIAFYRETLHAQAMEEWTTYRLTGETLQAQAAAGNDG